MAIVCQTLGHLASKILSRAGFYLEARAIVGPLRSLQVTDCLDKHYGVLKRSPIEVTPSLEIVIKEALRLEFTENTAFYCVFCYFSEHDQLQDLRDSTAVAEYSLVYIPNWFPQIMFATAGQIAEITNQHNAMSNQIKVQLPEIKLSKFDLMTSWPKDELHPDDR
jgi:hypothetical protein